MNIAEQCAADIQAALNRCDSIDDSDERKKQLFACLNSWKDLAVKVHVVEDDGKRWVQLDFHDLSAIRLNGDAYKIGSLE